MTQVAMIFEEEKQQAVKQAVEAERKKALESERQVIKKMIEKGYPAEEIVFLVAGCSMSDVEALREELQNKKDKPE